MFFQMGDNTLPQFEQKNRTETAEKSINPFPNLELQMHEAITEVPICLQAFSKITTLHFSENNKEVRKGRSYKKGDSWIDVARYNVSLTFVQLLH